MTDQSADAERLESVPVKVVEALRFFVDTVGLDSAPFRHARALIVYLKGLRQERDTATRRAEATEHFLKLESERRAALEAEVGRRGVLGPWCFDCGRSYGDDAGFPDLIISDASWKAIAPMAGGDGLLCPSCLCKRLCGAGIECEGRFTSGPLATPPAADHTELVEPLTGDTKVIDRRTGRIIETRPAADHTERAREIVDKAYQDGKDKAEKTGQEHGLSGNAILMLSDDYRYENLCSGFAAALTAAERAGADKATARYLQDHLDLVKVMYQERAAKIAEARAEGERAGAEKAAAFVDEYLPAHFELHWIGKEIADGIRALAARDGAQ